MHISDICLSAVDILWSTKECYCNLAKIKTGHLLQLLVEDFILYLSGLRAREYDAPSYDDDALWDVPNDIPSENGGICAT